VILCWTPYGKHHPTPVFQFSYDTGVDGSNLSKHHCYEGEFGAMSMISARIDLMQLRIRQFGVLGDMRSLSSILEGVGTPRGTLVGIHL
jgi:hypothetical protein